MDNKSIRNRKLKLAVVGCGRISANHFSAIQQYPQDLELVAVCDANANQLKKAQETYLIPGFPHLDGLLKNTDPDIVVLCTPSGLHARQTCEAALAGKHIITEKPMATRWQDGLEMVRACDQANVHLFVVKQNRRKPPPKKTQKKSMAISVCRERWIKNWWFMVFYLYIFK